MDVSYDEHEVRIGDETLTFGAEILDVVTYAGSVIVLLNSDDVENRSTNVIAYGAGFTRQWGARMDGDSRDAFFTDVFERDDEVVAEGIDGDEYRIDTFTGWAEPLE